MRVMCEIACLGFDFVLANQRDICMVIGEFLLHSPFKEKGCLLWFVGVFGLLWDLWGKRKNEVFRVIDWVASEVWSLVRFHVSRWASVLMNFYNYSLGKILVSCGVGVFPVGLGLGFFFLRTCILSFFSLYETRCFYKKKKKNSVYNIAL